MILNGIVNNNKFEWSQGFYLYKLEMKITIAIV